MELRINDGFIDLREEFDQLLKDYGHDVILIRVSKVTCTCADTHGEQVSDKCPKCLGIGRVIRPYRVKMIDESASQVVSLPNTTKFTIIGDIYSNAKAFYFRYNIQPKAGDYIYEVSWIGDRIATLHGVYKIEYAEPFRMDNGRIEYHLASGHRDVSNIQFKEQMLKRLPIRRLP